MITQAPALLTAPTREAFRALAAGHNLIPVTHELMADAETPVSLFRRFLDEPHAFLLESVEGGERWASHSFIGLNPFATMTAVGDAITLSQDGETRTLTGDPVTALRDLLAGFNPAAVPGAPRFTGGAVGYFGYDTVRHMERLPEAAGAGLPMPESAWMLPSELLIYHNLSHRVQLVHLARVAPGEDADAAYERATAAIKALRARLAAPAPAPAAPVASPGPLEFRANMTESTFKGHVEAVKEHIRAGDAFQVVLSQRFEADTPAPPFDVYRALRAINPSPYMYYMRIAGATIVGASPELLFRVESDRLTVRPIAGTRPRGATPAEDADLEAGLLADPKELAEHVMLIDLGRNDVGRVAELGSVRVVDRMVIERYSHVMHLVSSVEGRMPVGTDAFDALRATFPAGTLSGAPKVRAMQLIETHEPTRRGLYGGVVGYFGFNGGADLAIAIRTMVEVEGTKYFQTGAGIVYDSDPDAEYQETLHKARAITRAIEAAHAGLDSLS
ncbi:MAG: anthranilate synthase component I [Candidatus Sericytochromatia bacterium]